MRVGIVGYGRMGRAVRCAALQRGFEVPHVVDPLSNAPEVTSKQLESEIISQCDVMIDFSSQEAVMEHFALYAATPCRVVVGTTGWYDHLDKVEEMMRSSRSAVVYSGNFSLGVAVFLRLVREAVRLTARVGGYDAGVWEMHHTGKADSPSGTALMLAEEITRETAQKEVVSEMLHRRREKSEVQVGSLRVGSLAGTHTVLLDSEADTIELTHRAHGREGFASGAMTAAKWIMEQVPGLYSGDDFIESVLSN